MHKNPFSPRWAGLAVASLLLAGQAARADLIPWGYNWEASAHTIHATTGHGFLTLRDEPSAAASGNSNTLVTNIKAYSMGDSTFKPASSGYSFTVQLQDLASKATGSLTFTGYFSGNLTAESANIHNTITSARVQSLALGSNTYTVRLGTYTPPGPPGSLNAGALNAYISVAATNGGGHISSTPEPSALLLAGVALPWLGLCGWRKRKAARVMV